MKKTSENHRKSGSRVAAFFGIERRKAAVAASLVAVMAFMWIRMLTQGGPASALAESPVTGVPAASQAGDIRVIYRDMPVVAGRNDVLTCDFFAAGDWSGFLGRAAGERQEPDSKLTDVPKENERSSVIRKAAAGLKLQIIEMGTEPQAFISDQLVTAGMLIPLAVEGKEVVFEVATITATSVLIVCENHEFEIMLPGK